MATLSLADTLTPAEVAKRQNLHEQGLIIEVMKETNEMLLDATIQEASDGTVNRTTQRTSMPAGTRRVYGQGVLSHASTTRQIEDVIEQLADFSDVDAKMADHSPNKNELLRSEDIAFLEGMGQTQIDDLIYAKRADGPEYLDGLMVRLAALDTDNVFGVESSGSDMTSILIVKWGSDKAHLFYPRGDKGIGINREYRGKVDSTVDVTGGRPKILPVYRTWFDLNFGVSIRHPKAVKRIANIKVGTSTGEEIMFAMIKAMNKLPPGPGNTVIYANSDVKTVFDQYALTKGNLFYMKDDPWGRAVTMFRDARIRQVDALLNTEALIS